MPQWLKQLCAQRWVGQAVAQRAAWPAEHIVLDPYRFGRESLPDWHATNLFTYDRACLRELSETGLRWLLGMEVERLLRLVQTPAWELGEAAWLEGVLSASEHMAQVYHQLRQRHHAKEARAIPREKLRAFLDWRGNEVAQVGMFLQRRWVKRVSAEKTSKNFHLLHIKICYDDRHVT